MHYVSRWSQATTCESKPFQDATYGDYATDVEDSVQKRETPDAPESDLPEDIGVSKYPLWLINYADSGSGI